LAVLFREVSMPFSLAVDRSELRDNAVRLSRLAKRVDLADAVLAFREGYLEISLPGVSVAVAAQGEWTGEVRVAGAMMGALSKARFAANPVMITVADGRLHLASLSAPCTVQETGPATIHLPLNPTLADLLMLAIDYPDDVISRSGLSGVLRGAEAKRDAMIGSAQYSLREFGVSKDDLRRLVDLSLRNASQARNDEA
jgi:hypothetical protein